MKLHTTLIAATLLLSSVSASAAQTIYDFAVQTIDGDKKSLADYQGKVLLVVNTASRCGFTPQYAGLEKVYQTYKDQGFEILAFPANNFKEQEPGSNAEIKEFCSLKYKTTFPLFAKISVKGNDIAPLYKYLTTQPGFDGDISWNFNKFLIDRHGKIIARFGSKVTPEDPQIVDEVKQLLAAR
jgi:glutathione peroxidase